MPIYDARHRVGNMSVKNPTAMTKQAEEKFVHIVWVIFVESFKYFMTHWSLFCEEAAATL